MIRSKREFLLLITGVFAGGGAILGSLPFLRSLNPPDHVTRRTWDVSFPKLKPGQMMVAVVESRPIFITYRTAEQIEFLDKENDKLKDPNSLESDQPEFAENKYRSSSPEIFVAEGSCTHLGCSTTHVDETQSFLPKKATGGYFCPCHGALYDSSGRVFEGGPAPKNLKIPNYEFIDSRKIRISRSL